MDKQALHSYIKECTALCTRGNFHDLKKKVEENCELARADGKVRMVESYQREAIRLMVKYDQPKSAFQLASELVEHDFKLSKATYTAILMALKHNAMYHEVVSLYNELSINRVIRPHPQMNVIYLRSLNQLKRHEATLKAAEDMADHLNIQCYRIILDACNALKDMDRAKEILETLEMKGLRLTFYDYRDIVQAALRAKRLDIALDCHQELCTLNLIVGNSYATTYGRLATALVAAKEYQKVLDLQTDGMTAKTPECNRAVLQSLAYLGQLDEAIEYGLRDVNRSVVEVLIDQAIVHEAPKALLHIVNMRKPVNFVFSNSQSEQIIRSACKYDEPDLISSLLLRGNNLEARDIVLRQIPLIAAEMGHNDIANRATDLLNVEAPTVMDYAMLRDIDGLRCKIRDCVREQQQVFPETASELDKRDVLVLFASSQMIAQELLYVLSECSESMNLYNRMLLRCGRKGFLNCVPPLLEQLKQKQIQVESWTYAVLIRSCGETQDEQVLEAIELDLSKDMRQNVKVREALIEAYFALEKWSNLISEYESFQLDEQVTEDTHKLAKQASVLISNS